MLGSTWRCKKYLFSFQILNKFRNKRKRTWCRPNDHCNNSQRLHRNKELHVRTKWPFYKEIVRRFWLPAWKVGGMQSWFHFENWPETSHLFQLEQSQWWRAGERNVVSPVQPLPEETSGVRKKRPHYQWMVLFKIIQFCYIFLCSGVFVSLFVF